MSIDVNRFEGESEEAYVWRLGNAKDSGEIDMSWEELAVIINHQLGYDDKPFTEAAFRKPYQNAKRYYNAGIFDKISDDSHIENLKRKNFEIEKNIIKFRDERNETKRIIREESRKESYLDLFLRCISEHKAVPMNYDVEKLNTVKINTDNDLIISMTDIHTGIEIDNFFNKYNNKILKKRLVQYLNKIFQVQQTHNSESIYVILSELVSGIIHNSLRIESNQNLIEQFLTAMDCVSEFLSELSYKFNTVNVYMCIGNHSRIFANKDDSLKGENIDHLAIPFLEAKLQNFKNIKFNKNIYEESIAVFTVRNKIIMASHGDKDNPKNVVQKYTLMFDRRPDLIYLGHRHTNAMSTVYDVKVIQSGCLSGSDNYCMDNRLRNKPEQTISVITDKGLDCMYDVKFE